MAGVAGLPQASNINECDSSTAVLEPAETAANPSECRTSRSRDTDIDARLTSALYDAGRSALGMPGTVDTFKAMVDAGWPRPGARVMTAFDGFIRKIIADGGARVLA